MLSQKRRSVGAQVSIIIPTYNESKNIISILKSIGENLPKNIHTEAIVVDDNSPDGTGKIVEDYLNQIKKLANYTIDVIHRTAKKGLSSAILSGIQHAKGETIIVMDSDFSHPPQIIPRLVETLKKYQCDIVVASRYVTGGTIQGWSIKRKIISKIGTIIAKKGLGVEAMDPMSGFFAFKKNILNGLKFDALGYKMLLEILVKTKGVKVQEIPYTFTDRQFGSSKLSLSTIVDYWRSVWRLYRYGKTEVKREGRKSVRFMSKAARFFTVGASGLLVNYLVSLMFTSGITHLWYLHATVIGIIASISTNFILNKWWTFEDRRFGFKRTITQYGLFSAFSSFGALVQLGMVYALVDVYSFEYPIALVLAVLVAAFGNFVLNKKWTFKERIWD